MIGPDTASVSVSVSVTMTAIGIGIEGEIGTEIERGVVSGSGTGVIVTATGTEIETEIETGTATGTATEIATEIATGIGTETETETETGIGIGIGIGIGTGTIDADEIAVYLLDENGGAAARLAGVDEAGAASRRMYYDHDTRACTRNPVCSIAYKGAPSALYTTHTCTWEDTTQPGRVCCILFLF